MGICEVAGSTIVWGGPHEPRLRLGLQVPAARGKPAGDGGVRVVGGDEDEAVGFEDARGDKR